MFKAGWKPGYTLGSCEAVALSRGESVEAGGKVEVEERERRLYMKEESGRRGAALDVG